MTHPKHLTDYHFYASSCATWATTTPDRDLPSLIELMNREGYTYNIYMVPAQLCSFYQTASGVERFITRKYNYLHMLPKDVLNCR